MSENNKGLKFYDNLDLTTSEGDEDLQVVLTSNTVQNEGYYVVYKKWTVLDVKTTCKSSSPSEVVRSKLS
jgi:hypothetical protein